MPDRIAKTALATRDIDELVNYYRTEAGPTVALRFINNAERAFAHLAEMPRMGARLGFDQSPFPDIRRWHIEGFTALLILYRAVADGIEIIRVLHSSRDIAALFPADEG
jgi:toxin ParE1/3/4